MISVCLLCGLSVLSCDVHEFPDPTPKEMEFALTLNYDTEMPLYKIVEHEEITRGNAVGEEYSVRYIVKVYDANVKGVEARNEQYHFDFVKDDTSELDTTLILSILPGNYYFVVWTDYVKRNDATDLYYNTQKFTEIALNSDSHIGGSDLRDAFRGSVVSEVSKNVAEAFVEMRRPMAKFNFVSTDVEDFIVKVASTKTGDPSISSVDVDLAEYKAVFHYYGFMPYSYNIFTDKPADSVTGVSFETTLNRINSCEAELGFDYVFVNGSESNVVISVDIYDSQNHLISSYKPIEVPLVRSKLTTVKARFLTSEAERGVLISPDYDGEYNYQID